MSGYRWDPAVWREPSYMLNRREFGFRVWFTGAEVSIAKLLVRFRWMSR